MEYLQTTFGIECFPNFVVDYFDNKRDGGLLRKREFEHARIQTKSCELKRMTRPDVNTRQNVTILVQSGADVHFATLMMKYGIMESDKISKVCLFTGDGDFSEVLDLIENNFTGRSVVRFFFSLLSSSLCFRFSPDPFFELLFSLCEG